MPNRSDWGRVAAAALLSAVACACGGDDDASSSPEPLSLSALHAVPDVARGGRLVDGGGRQVLLRGVNVNAFAEYWQGGEFPTTFPLIESDVELMASIGWNTVRLLLSWSRVEPQPGVYDESYLDTIAAAVGLFAEYGIYTILDLHQDAWGATLAAAPGETCEPPRQPALGWDGAPGWATLDGGAPRCFVGVRESSSAVLAAFAAFWADEPAADGIGIRGRYVAMLAHLAERFAADSAVAGYDLMNEPNAFGADAQAALAEMYGDAIAAIRAAEDAAGGFHHLVFFEPSALFSAIGAGPPNSFPHDANVVYAPHLYTGGFDGGSIGEAAFAVARDEAALFGGAPVLSGEWGSDPRRASNAADTYFLDHQRLQDEFQFGATLWTWRESCGDPHKVQEARGGALPYPWGEFDVDCTTNTVVGLRGDLVDQLTRPLLRAAPGRVDALEYDPATGRFAATGVADGSEEELVLFYPAAKHVAPVATTTGLGEIAERAAPGGGVYISTAPLGGAWTLQVGE